jgi:hypothetical protein
MLIGVVVVLIAAAAFYWMISQVPEGYHPAQLSHAERLQVANTILPSDISDFHNLVQAGQLDTYVIREGRINSYLASLDEIATELRHARPGSVREQMERIGLAGPAVDLRDGSMVFMIRSTEHEKILSVEIALEVVQDRIRTEVRSVRVGSLPVPQALVRSQLRQAGRAMKQMSDDGGRDPNRGIWDAPATVLPAVLSSALEDQPLPAEFDVPVARSMGSDSSSTRRVRIEKIVIDEQQVQLWLDPSRPMRGR